MGFANKIPGDLVPASSAGEPAGIIVLIDATTGCPTGYTQVTAANGRFLIGVLDGLVSRAGGLIGTALTVAAPTRVITTVPAHTHPAGTLATVSAGGHSHNLNLTRSTGGGFPPNRFATTGPDQSNTEGTDTQGAHTHPLSGSTASTGDASVDVTPPGYEIVLCKKD